SIARCRFIWLNKCKVYLGLKKICKLVTGLLTKKCKLFSGRYKMNKEFEKFIEQTEKLMTASEKYVSGAEKELDEFCDGYFANDTDVENYCREKHIPTIEE
ncbi:MAG: hypothetical protein ABI315_10365, partial [Bacteroidia bacterium]